MKMLTPWNIDLGAWYVFGAYWAITALKTKRTKAQETTLARLSTIGWLGVAFLLMFRDWLRIGPLAWRFLPETEWITWLGVVLTWGGTVIAIWARYTIGEYWSARVTLKEDHKLIRSGPYAHVRHPIYTGMFIGTVGTALVVAEWRAVVAVVMLLIVHCLKAKREERMLAQEFGQEYENYRSEAGFLFPRLPGRSGPPERPGAGMDTPGAGS